MKSNDSMVIYDGVVLLDTCCNVQEMSILCSALAVSFEIGFGRFAELSINNQAICV